MKTIEREVNQTLWESVMTDNYNGDKAVDNEVFVIRPYDWKEPSNNDWNFWHKPSGLKISWYKYPLRSAESNMEISHEQFYAVLKDCMNFVHPGVKFNIDRWWDNPTFAIPDISEFKDKNDVPLKLSITIDVNRQEFSDYVRRMSEKTGTKTLSVNLLSVNVPGLEQNGVRFEEDESSVKINASDEPVLEKGKEYTVNIRFHVPETIERRKLDDIISEAICEVTGGNYDIGEYMTIVST